MKEALEQQLAKTREYYQRGGSRFSLSLLEEVVREAASIQKSRFEAWGGWEKVGPVTGDSVGVGDDSIRNAIYDRGLDGWHEHPEVFSKEQLDELIIGTVENDFINNYYRRALAGNKPRYCVIIDYLTRLCRHKKAQEDILLPICSFYSGGQGCVVKVRKGATVSRALLKAVRGWWASTPDFIAQMEGFMEAMGHLWSTDKQSLRVVMSCAPTDFLALGTYGENSCYRPGSEQEHSKLVLMNTPGAVAVRVVKGEDLDGAVVARAWGLYDDEHGLLVTNIYLMYWSQLAPLLKEALSEWLGEDNILTRSMEETGFVSNIFDRQVYTNNDEQLFYKGSNYTALSSALNRITVDKVIDRCGNCSKVGMARLMRHCESCEGRALCEDCVEPLQVLGGGEVVMCSPCHRNNSKQCSGCDVTFYARDAADWDEHGSRCADCGDWSCEDCADGEEDEAVCGYCQRYREQMKRIENGEEDVIPGCECAGCSKRAA